MGTWHDATEICFQYIWLASLMYQIFVWKFVWFTFSMNLPEKQTNYFLCLSFKKKRKREVWLHQSMFRIVFLGQLTLLWTSFHGLYILKRCLINDSMHFLLLLCSFYVQVKKFSWRKTSFCHCIVFIHW